METIKTKYRVYNDGYANYLQYEVKTTFLEYKIQSEWKYIPRIDCISEFIAHPDQFHINENSGIDFDEFVQKYPSITDYLCEYEIAKKLFEQQLKDKYNKKPKIIKEYE